MNEATLLASTQKRDLEIIGSNWREVLALIERNPFSERIFYLLAHQEIASVAVVNTRGISSPPNCIGTALYIAGVSTLPYPYHAYSYELNPHMEQPGEKRWDDFFWPHEERRIPGGFVFSFCAEGDGWHAGIYLGQIGDEHILFAQHDHGGNFGVETLARNYASPDYYVPSTLLKV